MAFFLRQNAAGHHDPRGKELADLERGGRVGKVEELSFSSSSSFLEQLALDQLDPAVGCRASETLAGQS